MNDLVKRAERLERTSRFLVAVMLALCGGLVLGASWQREIPDVVRAREFQAVDTETGETVATLGSYSGTGIGWLRVTSPRGGGFFNVTVTRLGPTLHLNGPSGRSAMLSATTSTDGGGDLVLSGAAGRVDLGSSERGPRIELSDPDANLRVALGVTAIEGSLTGETRLLAASSLVLFDEEGNVIYRAPPGR